MSDLDEFMPQVQVDADFSRFMQSCYTNPNFFESMKNFYMTQSQNNKILTNSQTNFNNNTSSVNVLNQKSYPNNNFE